MTVTGDNGGPYAPTNAVDSADRRGVGVRWEEMGVREGGGGGCPVARIQWMDLERERERKQ